MSDYQRAVLISYAWGEEDEKREAIVNQLDQSLLKWGLKIVRKNTIRVSKLLMDFDAG